MIHRSIPVLVCTLVGFACLGFPSTAARAQDPVQPPIDGDRGGGGPGGPGGLESGPSSGEDLPNTPPMVVPPPKASPPAGPDAFGETADPGDGAADTQDDAANEATDKTRAQQIDDLFAQLRKEASGRKGAGIAAKIQRLWNESGSATVDLLIQRSAEAMSRNENAAALDVLDQAIVLDPAYAEAWNRRASLNYSMDEWGKSLADIKRTLHYEPRHWGAMMGLALILRQTGHEDKALDVYLRVLKIYPSLKSAQDAVGELSEDLTGPAI